MLAARPERELDLSLELFQRPPTSPLSHRGTSVIPSAVFPSRSFPIAHRPPPPAYHPNAVLFQPPGPHRIVADFLVPSTPTYLPLSATLTFARAATLPSGPPFCPSFRPSFSPRPPFHHATLICSRKISRESDNITVSRNRGPRATIILRSTTERLIFHLMAFITDGRTDE